MLFELFLAFLSIYLWFRYKFSHWKRLGFPDVEGKFPFGSEPGVSYRMHQGEFLRREYERLKGKGPAFGIFYFTKPVLIPTDPDLIREILVKSAENFLDRGMRVSEAADPLSQHLFFKSGQEWKDLRQKTSPTFTSVKVKSMFPTVLQKCDRMVKHLRKVTEESEFVEMSNLFSGLTTEVIADIAFGLEVNQLARSDDEFGRMRKRVLEPTLFENLRIFFIMVCEKLSNRLGLGINSRDTIEFFMKVIKDTMEHRKRNKEQRNDFIQFMIELKNQGEISFNEMASSCFGLLLVG